MSCDKRGGLSPSIESRKRKDLLSEIKNRAMSAEKSFFFYLSFVSFTLVTTFGITDKQLLFRQYGIKLPIFNIDISIELFLIIAPFLCIIFFAHYTYYLFSLKKMVTDYRYDYPDNRGEFSGLWIIVFDLSCRSCKEESREELGRGELLVGRLLIVERVQRLIVYGLHIWLLPVALLLIGAKYARLHEQSWERVLGLLALIGLILNYLQYLYFRYYKGSLKRMIEQWYEMQLLEKFYSLIKVLLINILVVVCSITMLVEYNTFVTLGNEGKIHYFLGLKSIKLRNVLDLSYTDLTQHKSQYLRYWGGLEGIDLRGANLEGAILIKMNIKGCDFTGANMSKTDLRGAQIYDSTFDEVDLSKADFGFTDISGTSFVGADFREAKFKGNLFNRVSFAGADFANSTFISSHFSDCNLKWTNFKSSIFIYSIFGENNNLYYTNFESATIQHKYGLPIFAGEDEIEMMKVNFSIAAMNIFRELTQAYPDRPIDKDLYDRIYMAREFNNFINSLEGEFEAAAGLWWLEDESEGEFLSDSELKDWYYDRVEVLSSLTAEKEELSILFKGGLPEHFFKDSSKNETILGREELGELGDRGIKFKKLEEK